MTLSRVSLTLVFSAAVAAGCMAPTTKDELPEAKQDAAASAMEDGPSAARDRAPGADATVASDPAPRTDAARADASGAQADASAPKEDSSASEDDGGANEDVGGAAADSGSGSDTPPATSGSVLFETDFSTLSGWGTGNGEWSIVAGTLRGGEIAADGHYANFTRALPLENVIVTMDLRFDGGDKFTFHINNLAAGGNEHLNRMVFDRAGSKVAIGKLSGWGGTSGGGNVVEVPYSFMAGKWYKLRMEIQGARIRVDIDGKKVTEAQVGLPQKPRNGTALGVHARYVSFDNLTITKIAP
jgi:hypothetical protein